MSDAMSQIFCTTYFVYRDLNSNVAFGVEGSGLIIETRHGFSVPVSNRHTGSCSYMNTMSIN